MRHRSVDQGEQKLQTRTETGASVETVVVSLFIGTQKRLVALHSALDGSRRDGRTARAV